MRVCSAIVLIGGIALSQLASSAPTIAAPTSTGSANGWSLLWTNQDVAARKLFSAAVVANPADADSLRGLAILDAIEDRPLQQVDHLAAMYKWAPGTAFADACWPEFDHTCTTTGRFATLKSVATTIVASKSAHSHLKADATLSLAAVLEITGDRQGANRLKDSLGFITTWNVIGPFTNTSRSGFDTSFGPESEIDFTKSYAGDNDRHVSWRRLADIDDDDYAQVGESLSESSEELGYVVTAVKSPGAMDAVLTLDCDGAYRVSVNGKSAANHALYGTATAYEVKSVDVPIKLTAGWNTILIKIANDEQRLSTLRVRITNVSGGTLLLPADPSHAGGSSTLAAGTPDPKPYTAQELARVPNTPDSLSLAADALDHTGDDDAVIAAAQAALAAALNRGALLSCPSPMHSARQLEPTMPRQEMNLAATADPRLLEAQVIAIGYKLKELTTAQGINRLKALLAISPDSPQIFGRHSRMTIPEAALIGRSTTRRRSG